MKINYLIILAGIIIFIIGLSILVYEIFLDSNFKLNVETELLILFGVVCVGMIIAGVGAVLEFSKKNWGLEK